MTTRELHTADGTAWTLAQASGTDTEHDADTVPVVATPSRGEQSVRLNLSPEWASQSDEDLVRAVEAERG